MATPGPTEPDQGAQELKPNAQIISGILRENGITDLYHFTDRRNWEVIQKRGALYSWAHLQKKKLQVVAPGGDDSSREVDCSMGFSDYIHLSFCRNHPMCRCAVADGRIQEPVLLRIDPVVASWAHSCFADRNLLSPNCHHGPSETDLRKIRLDIVKLPSQAHVESEAHRPLYQAEVLIKKAIALTLITEVSLSVDVGARRDVRVSGDRWRYQKECANYYKTPVTSFFQELLQNSLDACTKVHRGKGSMEVTCDIKDVQRSGPLGEVGRVEVCFEDNGCGMNEETVINGLLRLASSCDTRTDEGLKRGLTDCAGGFGLAKVLLLFAQDAVEVFTKTSSDKHGVYLFGEFGREDQEGFKLSTLRDEEVSRQSALPCRFASGSDQHGTRMCITLNPWVMGLHGERDRPITEQVLRVKSQARSSKYVELVMKLFELNKLPVQFRINGTAVEMAYDVGTKICDLKTQVSEFAAESDDDDDSLYYDPDEERTFGALYARTTDYDCPDYKVELQVLRRLGSQTNCENFLHCFTKKHGQQNLKKQLVVVLFNVDEHDNEFQVGQLLSGTRDALANIPQMQVDNAIQKYFVDPNLVKPAPESTKALVSGKNVFSEWFDRKCREDRPKRNPDYWTKLTRNDASSHLGTEDWRGDLGYTLWSFKEKGLKDTDVPLKFSSPKHLDSADVMWLEIFGAYVRLALEAYGVLQDTSGDENELPSTAFEVGFFVTKDAAARGSCANPGPVVSPASKKNDLYLLVPEFRGRPEGDCTERRNLKKAVFQLKMLAVHQVAHLKFPWHGPEFIDHLEALNEEIDEVERMGKWSWFHVYRRRVEDRILRDTQNKKRIPELVRHMAAMEAVLLEPDSAASYASLQTDIEAIHIMMKDAFRGRDLSGCEGRIPLKEMIQKIAKENQELRKTNKALSRAVCKFYKRGTNNCWLGDQCPYMHGVADNRWG